MQIERYHYLYLYDPLDPSQKCIVGVAIWSGMVVTNLILGVPLLMTKGGHNSESVLFHLNPFFDLRIFGGKQYCVFHVFI